MTILQPPGLAASEGLFMRGQWPMGPSFFVSGQIGWDEHGHLRRDDIAGQVRQALRNVVTILAEAGARPEDVARLTWYVTDKHEYLAAPREIGAAYREVMGRHFPAMSVVGVAALVEDEAKVEIEATALSRDAGDEVGVHEGTGEPYCKVVSRDVASGVSPLLH